TAPGSGAEAVAEFHAFDRLDAHEGPSQPRVEAAVPVDVAAQAGRQPVGDDFDDSAEGVAGLAGVVYFGDHAGAGLRVEAAHRVGVDAGEVLRGGDGGVVGDGDAAHRHDVADDFHAERLAEELAGDFTQGDARGGLAGAGALQDRAGFVIAVLLHAHEVGVPRPGAGQGGVARHPFELLGGHGVGGHDFLPFGPFGVAHLDRHRPAEGAAVTDPSNDGDLVLLELHAGAPAVPGATTEQGGGDVVRGDGHAGR